MYGLQAESKALNVKGWVIWKKKFDVSVKPNEYQSLQK